MMAYFFSILWIITILFGVFDDIKRAIQATKKIRKKKLFAILCEIKVGAIWIWYCADYIMGDTETISADIISVSFMLALCGVANYGCKWHDEEGE